jgi:photosynthetic reaction center H subunit
MADRDLNDARYGATGKTSATTTGATATGTDTDLRRLSDLDDFEVADGHPDIRGWTVKTPDGQTLGKVDDLVVSVREMRVRYIDVDVDRSVRSGLADAATPKGAEAGHALVPIGTAQLDDNGDNVIVRSLTGADLASYPLYARQGGITRDYEQSLRGRFGGATTGAAAGAAGASSDFYGTEHYDESRFFDRTRGTSRTTGTTGTTGATGATGGLASSAGAVGDSAREIPTSRETVGAQESAFQRDSVLRRRAGTSEAGMSGATDRATSSGLGDRLADKVDDLKDRVDGNPASKPGPDATDRRI